MTPLVLFFMGTVNKTYSSIAKHFLFICISFCQILKGIIHPIHIFTYYTVCISQIIYIFSSPDCETDLARYQPVTSCPNTETVRGMPFDYTIHDPKYEDISTVYSPDFTPNSDGETIKTIMHLIFN